MWGKVPRSQETLREGLLWARGKLQEGKKGDTKTKKGRQTKKIRKGGKINGRPPPLQGEHIQGKKTAKEEMRGGKRFPSKEGEQRKKRREHKAGKTKSRRKKKKIVAKAIKKKDRTRRKKQRQRGKKKKVQGKAAFQKKKGGPRTKGSGGGGKKHPGGEKSRNTGPKR